MDGVLSSYGVADTAAGVGGFKPRSPQLIVVDNFYDNPEEVRDIALAQEFSANLEHHKGRRTKFKFLFPYQKEEFERLIGSKIKNWLTHRYNGVFYALTKSDPVVFHSDGQAYAATVYLTPDAPIGAGTSFFRSKATGLRKPPTSEDCIRTRSTVTDLSKRTYGGKLMDPAAWDYVDTVGNVFNRLVIWDAQLIHAGNGYFGDNLHNGRLSHLFFFDVHAQDEPGQHGE